MTPDLIDIRTVLLLITLVSMTTAAAVVLLWRNHPEEEALSIWALGALLIALGYLGIGLRGAVPLWVSVPLANMCITVGHASFLRGVDKFADRKPLSWWTIAAIGVAIFASLSYFIFVHESTAIRMAVQFTALALLSTVTALRLFGASTPETRDALRGVAGGFLVFGSILLLRLVLMIFEVPGQDLFGANTIHALVFVAMLLFYAALMYCFPALLYAKDSARRKQVQENYRNIVKTAIDGFWAVDLSGRLIDVNDAYGRMSGYRQDELLGKHVQDIEAAERPEETKKHIEKVMLDGADRFESRHRRKDGTIFDVEISAHFSSSQGGMFVAFIQDISARKRAEQEIRQTNAMLEKRVLERTADLEDAKNQAERSSHAKSEFLSRMSHELRTPLNAILGFGQLLELEVRDAQQADNVREVMRAGQHLLELINEVLDLARIESGKFTISQESVPLLPLIEECMTLMRPLAETRGVRFVDTGHGCGGHVLADRFRLKQVLLNLLSNAVKYNRAQGTVGIACVADGDSVQIRISDSGPGLTPEQQGRLFVAFERLGADQNVVEGTGIGLALSKRLTELMGGQIGVESAPGQGSTFWVRLAVTQIHPGAAPEAEGFEVPAKADGHRQFDVLCIEDNPANLRLIERILARRDDVRMLSASAPGLGLELAVAYRPALILLDINLPDMDGYEVMQCLRENALTRGIPVVAISANAMAKDLARGKAAGFVEYLTKPLNVGRFNSVVDDILKPTGSAEKGAQ